MAKPITSHSVGANAHWPNHDRRFIRHFLDDEAATLARCRGLLPALVVIDVSPSRASPLPQGISAISRLMLYLWERACSRKGRLGLIGNAKGDLPEHIEIQPQM